MISRIDDIGDTNDVTGDRVPVTIAFTWFVCLQESLSSADSDMSTETSPSTHADSALPGNDFGKGQCGCM